MRHAFFVIALTTSLSLTPAFSNNETSKSSTIAKADPDQSIRCRRVDVTGSLVKKGKVCKTIAEWRAIMDNNNYLARKMIEDGTTRPGGN